MSKSVAIIEGKVGNKIHFGKTKQNVAVCNFQVSTPKKTRTKEGKEVVTRQWHKITVWGKMATVLSKNLLPGSLVHVQGELHNRTWVDKEGYDREDTEIHTENVEILRG